MTNWPFISRAEFDDKERYKPLDYYPTTGKKQHNKLKYKLYWSPKAGGVWVENE